jgi:magnesium-transporting ATPase (P-type)
MLWVNMIMDTFAALALATEEPHPKLLKRPPHSRDSYIVSMVMLKHILVHTVFQSIVILIFTFTSEKFVKEPLKDNDSSLSSIITPGALNEVWEKFDNKNSGNRFNSRQHFNETIEIFCRPENEYIVSGKAYSGFG